MLQRTYLQRPAISEHTSGEYIYWCSTCAVLRYVSPTTLTRTQHHQAHLQRISVLICAPANISSTTCDQRAYLRRTHLLRTYLQHIIKQHLTDRCVVLKLGASKCERVHLVGLLRRSNLISNQSGASKCERVHLWFGSATCAKILSKKRIFDEPMLNE